MGIESDIKAIVRASAEETAAKIMKIIGRASVSDLIKLTGGKSTAASAAQSAPAASKSTKKSAAKSSGSKPDAKPAGKSKPEKAAAKGGGKKLTPQQWSAAVLEVLESSAEPVKATQIVGKLEQKVGGQPSAELLGRVLRELGVRGLVTKSGNTRATLYQVANLSEGAGGAAAASESSVEPSVDSAS